MRLIAASIICASLTFISQSQAQQQGIASVYSYGRTATGERVDGSKLTAAHRSLPFNTRVRVTNLRNRRSVVVRINDRGPFVRGRIIDLTPAGAHALGFSGLASVSLAVVGHAALEADTDISAARRHHAYHRHHVRRGAWHHRHFVRSHHEHHGKRVTARAVGLGNVGGLQSQFRSALTPLLQATGCRVGSGLRSHSQQAALYRAKPGLAAPPGHSNHERGLAADLSCSGGGLSRMHRLASAAGLRFPMSYEPWHIEPAGATRVASHRHVHIAALNHYRHAFMHVRHRHWRSRV